MADDRTSHPRSGWLKAFQEYGQETGNAQNQADLDFILGMRPKE